MDVNGLEIAVAVCAPVRRAHDVVHLQAVVVPKGQSTDGAAPVLALEQTSHGGVRRPVRAQAPAPIEEVAVVRRGRVAHFNVPLVVHRRVSDEAHPLWKTETPPLPVTFMPIAFGNPVRGLVRMASAAPATEHRIHRLVAVVEGFDTQDMAVVRTPRADLRV